MSIFNNNLLAGAAAQGGTTPVHTIDQSIRFNALDNPYMIKAFSSKGSPKKFTLSWWTKLGERTISATSESQMFFIAYHSSGYQTDFSIQSAARAGGVAHTFRTYSVTTGGSAVWNFTTTQVFRDPSAWYNFVVVSDTDNAVSTERFRLYVNGQRVTDFSTATYPGSGVEPVWNNSTNVTHYIGSRAANVNTRFDGYMAEMVHIDGQALDPSSFGEYSSSNIWIPKDVSELTFGTNGFHIDGRDANNLGKDSSGNDNNFANSLHTFEPSQSNGSLSNGNLTTSFASVTNFRGGRGFVGKSSGKWYAEVTIDNRGASGGSGRSSVGITRAASFGSDTSTNAARDSVGAFTYSREGAKEQGTGSGVTSTSTGYASFSNGDVIGVALNMDDGEVYFYKNGTAQDSGTAAFTGLGSNTYDLIAIGFGGFQSTVNFGATAFSYTPPTGYTAWDAGSSALLPNDQVPDSPTNNHCTWNPLRPTGSTTMSDGNLTVTTSGATYKSILGTIGIPPNSGIFYYEGVVLSHTIQLMLGWGSSEMGVNQNNNPATPKYFAYADYLGKYYSSSGDGSVGDAFENNDVIGLWIDTDNTSNNLKFYRNGTLQSTHSFDFSDVDFIMPLTQHLNGCSVTGRFASNQWTQTPSGITDANAINTKNLGS